MYLLMRARERLCAMPLEKVLEVTRPLPLETFPRMPGFVLGLCRMRGEDLPVIDLGVLLGLGAAPQPTRFVVTSAGERRVILAVESTASIESLDPGRLRAMPTIAQEADEALIGWISRRDDELVMILDAARLLDTMPEGGPGEE